MMLSGSPYKNNKYRVVNGVYYDTDIRDINPDMSSLLKNHGISYISVTEGRGIEDRSWEMSVALTASRKRSTFATGTLESYSYGKMKFGKIFGLDAKAKLHQGMRLEYV